MSENIKRPRGRPVVGAVPVTLRLLPEVIEWLDIQREAIDPPPSRPEMIRRLIDKARDSVRI